MKNLVDADDRKHNTDMRNVGLITLNAVNIHFKTKAIN